MKKLFIVCVCCLCCVACSKKGSIGHDNLNLERLSAQIDENLEDGIWHMGVLQDPISMDQIAEEYGITSDLVSEGLVRKPLIEATCDEIAIFHVKEGKMDEVEQALQERKARKIADAGQMAEQKSLLEQANLMKKGNYMIYVCGNDQANVIQYISSLD